MIEYKKGKGPWKVTIHFREGARKDGKSIVSTQILTNALKVEDGCIHIMGPSLDHIYPLGLVSFVEVE